MIKRFMDHPWRKKLTPSPSTLILLGLIVYFWFRPPAWISDEHRPVAHVAVQLSNGQTVRLASLRGKVVVVSFWATWCPYCRHELPSLQSFYSDWRDKGVQVLALSIEDDPAPVAKFMRENAYTFPVGLADATIQQAFGGIKRVPVSFIIDKRGAIRYKISGQIYYGRLSKLVTPLLRE
ncbi:MAG TPA: TlpA disulfide reductase family protein [Burkholderiales bacterium]|nr:TlpA disulfide reductase family protein [Burkholderiales bacterium]